MNTDNADLYGYTENQKGPEGPFWFGFADFFLANLCG